MKKLLLVILSTAISFCTMAGALNINTTFSPSSIFEQPVVGSITSGNFTVTLDASPNFLSADLVTIVGYVGGSPSTIVGVSNDILTIPFSVRTLTSNISYTIDLRNYTQPGTISGYFQLNSTSRVQSYIPYQVPFSFVVTQSVATSVDHLPTMADAINVFPNPSTIGYVDVVSEEPFKADIYTLNGTLVQTRTGSGSSRIPISEKGPYIIKVQTASKQTTRKLIIE